MCVICESLARVVIFCLASTHTALVSSPSQAIVRLSYSAAYIVSFLAHPVSFPFRVSLHSTLSFPL